MSKKHKQTKTIYIAPPNTVSLDEEMVIIDILEDNANESEAVTEKPTERPDFSGSENMIDDGPLFIDIQLDQQDEEQVTAVSHEDDDNLGYEKRDIIDMFNKVTTTNLSENQMVSSDDRELLLGNTVQTILNNIRELALWAVISGIIWFGDFLLNYWIPLKNESDFDLAVRKLLKNSRLKYKITKASTREAYAWMLSDYTIHENHHYFKMVQQSLVPFQDGILNVQDQTISPPSLQFRLTYRVELTYDEVCNCEIPSNLENELKRLVGNDESMLCRLQEACGVTLGTCSLGKIIYFQGAGNGPQILIDTLCHLFPASCISFTSMHDVDMNFRTANYLGAHLVLSYREGLSIVKNVETIIKAASGDGINTDRKFGNTFDFISNSVLVCAGKSLPQFADCSVNVLKNNLIRVILTGDESFDYGRFKSILLSNKAAFVKWALCGFERLYHNNFNFTEADGCDIEGENSDIAMFIEQSLHYKPKAKLPSSELLSEYTKFAENIGKPTKPDYAVHAMVKETFGVKPSSIRNADGKVVSGYKGLSIGENDSIDDEGTDTWPPELVDMDLF